MKAGIPVFSKHGDRAGMIVMPVLSRIFFWYAI